MKEMATSEAPDTEEIDALPVLGGDGPPVARPPSRGTLATRSVAPTVQAAAVAATGFVVGAATVGLVSRRRQRRSRALARGGSRRRLGGRRKHSTGPVGELVQIVGSRSLLVDVHLLGGTAGNR
jgi:hypothetical protein